MTSLTSPTNARAPRFPALQWWIRDRDGEVALAQVPNPALSVWVLASVVNRVAPLDGGHAATLTRLGQGALAAWALDELLRGASPARRLVGAVVLPLVLWRAFG